MKHCVRTAVWLPPLYFAEGLPAAVVTEVSLLLFHDFGMGNSGVAFWTNLLGLLPLLFIKLFCGPAVDAVSTRRRWIALTQGALGALFLLAALACRLPAPIPCLIVIFFAAALVSGVHDIAADGFYILALSEHEQAFYSGMRSVFYRVAMVVGSGGFIIFAGFLSERTGWLCSADAWAAALLAAALMMGGTAWFSAACLPRPETDVSKRFSGMVFLRDFGHVFISFFRKKHVWTALCFLLLYRLGEAQLGAVSKLFLLDRTGGMGLTQTAYGFMVGTLGVCMMLAGGVAAGILCGVFGMKKMLWPMALAINLPDALYLMLAFMKSAGLPLIGSCIAVEQFGYGFGFAGYMLFMVWFASTSENDCKTSHFALMTLFMIAGIRLPGMPSGWIAEHIGSWIPCGLDRYQLFFIWVLVCTIPGFFMTWLISRIVDPRYGRKTGTE